MHLSPTELQQQLQQAHGDYTSRQSVGSIKSSSHRDYTSPQQSGEHLAVASHATMHPLQQHHMPPELPLEASVGGGHSPLAGGSRGGAVASESDVGAYNTGVCAPSSTPHVCSPSFAPPGFPPPTSCTPTADELHSARLSARLSETPSDGAECGSRFERVGPQRGNRLVHEVCSGPSGAAVDAPVLCAAASVAGSVAGSATSRGAGAGFASAGFASSGFASAGLPGEGAPAPMTAAAEVAAELRLQLGGMATQANKV